MEGTRRKRKINVDYSYKPPKDENEDESESRSEKRSKVNRNSKITTKRRKTGSKENSKNEQKVSDTKPMLAQISEIQQTSEIDTINDNTGFFNKMVNSFWSFFQRNNEENTINYNNDNIVIEKTEKITTNSNSNYNSTNRNNKINENVNIIGGGEENIKIKIEEIEINKSLASGAYGEVFEGKYRGSEVAIKVFKSNKMDSSTVNMFQKEVTILSKLRHPNIVFFFGYSIDPPKLLIVTEYLSKGSLYDKIHGTNSKVLEYSTILKYCNDIAAGLMYIHSKQILHRDLSPKNLLITHSDSIKLCDFGISRKQTKEAATMTGFIGTMSYMSPELYKKNNYSEKVDIYSLGITLWEMYTGRFPYENMVPVQIAFKVSSGLRPTIPSSCPKFLSNLMSQCWSASPSLRPSAAKIVDSSLNTFF